MLIEEIDARTASDEVLARFHELELVCHEELAAAQPYRTRDETIAFHRHLPEAVTRGLWLAAGGAGELWVHGPTATFCDVLVHPGERRRGLGTALLERIVARCRELGVVTLRGQHTSPAGAAFCAHAGAADEQRVIRYMLDLRAVDLPEPVVPAGFRLVNWRNRVPDEHLAEYVKARAAMDDAPAPDDMDYPTATAERVREEEESCARRNREMLVTVAMSDTGEVASFTELRVTKGSPLGITDDTGTVAAHRGKGLARAVKLESLRRVRAEFPEVTVITTRNAEENAAMRGINESVGFRPTVVETTAALAITAG